MEEVSSGSKIQAKSEKKKFVKRTRRQLTPDQRVAVIERYEQKASVRSLAVQFKCGRTQIKSILRNRNLHLDVYARCQQQESKLEQSPQANTILAAVLYEWIKRARCYEINITDDILCSFAQEIADHLNTKDLTLDHQWLANFKQMYKLTEKDFHFKREQFVRLGKRKPLSIGIIIQDMQRKHGSDMIPFISSSAETQVINGESESGEDNDMNLDKDDPDYAIEASPLDQEEDSGVQMEAVEMNIGSIGRPNSAEMPIVKEIQSYREALNHLGPLEQFALMKENIRAIGLINQLENLFREKMEETI